MTKIIEVPETELDKEAQAKYEAEKNQREIEEVNNLRRGAYQVESDPIYFQAQRGDSYTLDDWKAKVAEIDARFPYPAAPKK